MRGNHLAELKAASASGLLAGYSKSPLGGYDEMVDSDGAIRPHWRAFVTELGRYSDPALGQMWETAQRLIRENGTTYNVYDAEDDAAHPWRMDPIPFMLDPGEWRRLEAGLIQRARLLNAVVADIYGDQRLMQQGLLPSPLVFGNTGFLRPMHGVRPRGDVHLHVLAFDLARGADQNWWVLSDRTQAPSGAGYALENRIVLSRTLPDIFRNARVHRLAGFFQAMADGLLTLTGRDDPLAVVLTPGPRHETYFEHAYLARYMGFPLVEGADLTVRDNRVYLKTLSGLRQVDLILRRIDGDHCDPLELRTDSLDGVAGLVEAVRAGTVVVANSLGSGVIESEALMAFYPGLCRALLGEDLLVPSIATWWCGQPAERDFVVKNYDRLAIRRTFARTSIASRISADSIPSARTAADSKAELQRLNLAGHEYYGQESPTFSTTPVWRDGALAPSPMALRMFVCFDGKGYRVMPGGMTRTTDDFGMGAIRLGDGDASKDSWVLSDLPVSTFTRLAAPDQPITLRRSGANLASRAADNLYWLGRYAERAESSMRLIRAMLTRLSGEAGEGEDPLTLSRLVSALVEVGHLPESARGLAAAGELRTLERELARMLSEPGGPNGLLSLLAGLDRIASLVRERLSVDSWRILNNLRTRAEHQGSIIRLDMDNALALLNAMLADLTAFSGMQKENMTRSVGWRMMDIGRRIERAQHMTALLTEMAIDGDPARDGRLDLLLELGDSAMTYRTRYITSPRLAPVVDLLLTDDSNPRSVAYQAFSLAEHVRALPRAQDAATLSREEYLIELLTSRLRLADVQGLCDARDDDGARSELRKFLEDTETEASEFSDALARKYFSHVTPKRSAFAGTRSP